MYCIQTDGLTYSYSRQERILNGLNLKIPQGSIYGFLGPNGAGKTTTLRLILGLIRKQNGSVTIFGKPFEGNRIEILKRTGTLIESPSIYANLTAAENLKALQYIYQCPESRINDVLKMVGLHGTGNKMAGKFSLGMKQRLSIAMALLNNPELLILDEPTNGLDPNGIIEIRELLKKLNKEQGMTIVISSHLLGEVEKLVSDVGIIHNGSLLFQGTLQELKIKQENSAAICFETGDAGSTFSMFVENGITPLGSKDGKVLIPPVPKEKIAFLNRILNEASVDVYSISIQHNDLESIFINLIK
ncbi:MAG: ABC transporter ATP-binding protein [Chitinophagaceae bacterium]|jgi:ABC-2 type transport system ATP-binding protein